MVVIKNSFNQIIPISNNNPKKKEKKKRKEKKNQCQIYLTKENPPLLKSKEAVNEAS